MINRFLYMQRGFHKTKGSYMNEKKKQFRIHGHVPALNRGIDETIEASSPIEARRLMEERLERTYAIRRVSVSYCLVDEVEEDRIVNIAEIEEKSDGRML